MMGQIKDLLEKTDPILEYANDLMDQKIVLMDGLSRLGDYMVKTGDKEGQQIISDVLIKYYQI